MHLKSTVLANVPGVIHGFGTLQEPVPQLAGCTWDENKPIWKQVHGVQVAELTSEKQSCGEVDGLFTKAAGIPLGIVTADCVPVLLAHKEGKWVAGVHAGWRGTRAGILAQLWSKLESNGENPANWVAAVGPSIGPCCYEVSEELARDFEKEFAELGSGLAVPRHRILDLPAINAAVLKKLGFHEVEVIRACTRCSKNPAFHSYRREGTGTRQYSIIMRQSLLQSAKKELISTSTPAR